MTRRTVRLSALAFLCAALSAQASPANPERTQVILYDRELQFVMPSGLDRVTDRANDTHVLIEYVPRGQTTANWTTMVTIQAYRGLGRSPMTSAAIARQAFFPRSCQIEPIYRDFGEHAVGRGLSKTIITIGCGSLPSGAYPKALPGAGEQDFIILFRDDETLYTLNYAVRGKPFRVGAPPRDPSTAAKILSDAFGEVQLERLTR